MYTLFTDAGHGWLQVTWEEINMLGIADQISKYSYVCGEHVYLEEDCDAGLFINALENKGGKLEYIVKHTKRDSPIRKLAAYAWSRP